MRSTEDFDAFVAATASRLLRTAYLMTEDRRVAEDMMRDALVRVRRRWSRVRTIEDLLPYARQVLVASSRRHTTDERIVMVLSSYDDLDDVEVADALRTTVGAVQRLRDNSSSGRDAPDLRDELRQSADDVGVWAGGGAEIRVLADQGRSRRRRIAGFAVLAAAAAVAVIGMTAPQAAPEPEPVDLPALLTAKPDPAWTDVELTPDMKAAAIAAVGDDRKLRTLVSTRLPDSKQVVAVLATDDSDGGAQATTVTFDSDAPGADVRRGTTAHYFSTAGLIAQPARAGRRSVLVVTLPPNVGDTVQVTSSIPGQPLERTSAFLHHRLAIVPVRKPAAVTRLQVLRRGQVVVDTVPAGSLLGPDVPRTLDRVVASAGPAVQPVQVRTNGRVACRITAGGYWPRGPALAPWNPSDSACADIDGGLQLLLAADRHDSTVAGVAPSAARVVRLHWADGQRTEIRTSGLEANAFVDPQVRRADLLVRADAVAADGAVVGSAIP